MPNTSKCFRRNPRVSFVPLLLFIWLLTAGAVLAGETHFIMTSDQHYGMNRPEFRGQKDVPAEIVNGAMVDAINKFVDMTFPNDGGVMACKKVSGSEFVVSGGDIASRMEGTDASKITTAAECWEMFTRQYIDGLAAKNSRGEKAEILVVPGNHDATNAIGFFRAMTPSIDRTPMVNMYNRSADNAIQPANFNYDEHKIFMIRDLGGAKLFIVQMWPDSAMRERMDREIAALPAGTPVILVTHIQPDIDANRLTNPNGARDVNETDKYENLVADVASVNTIAEKPIAERRTLAQFIKSHPSIIAYFHGHEHGNVFYNWTGPDGDISLPTFMVDSPVRGVASNKDESKMSFQSVAVDTDARRMTVREIRWNVNPADPVIAWGDSVTFNYDTSAPAAPTLVFGHKNPDTDTAVSAMAAANLLNKTGVSALAAAQGELNPESAFVMERFGLDAPQLLPAVEGRKIALVDFNEKPQGPDDLEKAELTLIVDHHRLGGLETAGPVEVRLSPVGATATLLYEMHKENDVSVPVGLAGGMLSAILSDTVSFKSATTTDRDRAAARELATLAGVSDMDALGKELFAVKSDFAGATSRELLVRDYKDYVMGDWKIGIGQIEALDISILDDRRAEFFEEMEKLKQEADLNAVVLMLTDITREGAEMLVIADDAKRIASPFSATLMDGSFWLEGVMSRKAQVVPPLEKAFAK